MLQRLHEELKRLGQVLNERNQEPEKDRPAEKRERVNELQQACYKVWRSGLT